MKRPDRRGEAAFDAYYGELYGERWERLRDSLLAASASTALTTGLARPYYLDPASVLAALALDIRGDERVLDLCAAPGGKTLVIASRIGGNGSIVANERSSARRARLHRVLDEHLDATIRARVAVTGHDASRWGVYEPAAYDRVLADVPCSSEQHVVHSPSALAEWSPSRTKRLTQGAYAIACAAADAVAPGGRIVYATCALSPLENDGVVSRLLARDRSPLRIVDAGTELARVLESAPPELVAVVEGLPGTPTEYGWHILPDVDHALGPMYVAIIERIE